MYLYIHDLNAFDGATNFLLILQHFFINFFWQRNSVMFQM